MADEWIHQPTFEVASVKLFRVVLLPDDGLPTKPINGSRGILCEVDYDSISYFSIEVSAGETRALTRLAHRQG
jgi:hypothetical protein